ncbi:hypothetical protein V8G54_013866 [Vigna mungo]|uniref:Uncharacterized protein n=1 Tax=Vigna mungo TaxID=3915 RepID=A0AAQ3NI01_VIGMU
MCKAGPATSKFLSSFDLQFSLAYLYHLLLDYLPSSQLPLICSSRFSPNKPKPSKLRLYHLFYIMGILSNGCVPNTISSITSHIQASLHFIYPARSGDQHHPLSPHNLVCTQDT